MLKRIGWGNSPPMPDSSKSDSLTKLIDTLFSTASFVNKVWGVAGVVGE
jgi:hypothetical protein